MLETQGLTKSYGKLEAVKSLDLRVDKGEIFGLLGPNGAGKTTAISMVAGVVTPTGGTASVAGFDTRRQSFDAKRALGLVPQDLAVYEEITATQNLEFFGSLYGLRGSKLRERVGWALEVAGLSERATEPVSRFSGGMKRRLNLVAGLLHKPDLLILDEPTVGVDPQSRNYIFDTIRALQSDHGMTVIYTSHYMEEVQSLCDRVGIIDDGTLIALDRVEDLLAAHGTGVVELEIEGDADAAAKAVASMVDATLADGVLRFESAQTSSLGAIIRSVEDAECTVVGVRTVEPNLETVFLAKTGHSLRDES